MKKILFYSLLAVGVVGLVSASAVSAQGFFYNHNMDSNGVKGNYEKGANYGYENMLQAKAEILGLSVDDLNAAKEEGKAFQEIAEEQGVDLGELRAQAREKKMEQKIQGIEAHLAQLVADGEITQEQADYKIERMQERFENFEERGKSFYRNNGEGRFMNCHQDNF